ncbi:MAG: bifunctional diaminohydroxyphosphoribosylaminopyrimidine deaminase/5-amino-6-(5-phosphoribosylamino)uracil reductase RibD [Bryobacterales bacterium]|nr:bifunctional diaminohydroxyphosphoribosylaminopyrimidine deaminase/5-amino-6-(5-phosphoribosylamino)uracil reductase RibD [Bryobacterales bacterium]
MNPDYLAEALALARLGEGQTSPNPMVGAVVVRDGVAVGRGFHIYERRKHAEVLAIEEAGDRARGATLYVSLEPCSHDGRTPPCTDAIVAAGIAKVVAPIADPNPLVSGSGFEKLRSASVAVEVDDRLEAEAQKLNQAFFHFQKTHRPLVTLKSAMTLDGKIAAPMDNDGWITSERARAHVQTLRHASDCILTGIGTVLGDDCMLTDRTGLPRSRPLMRLVVDSQLRVPHSSKLVESAAGDLTIVTTSVANAERRAALEARGIEVVAFDGRDGRTDLVALVEWLGTRNCLSLMIEAGSMVNWAALEAGVVDRVFFYYAPKILGGTKSLPVAGGTGKRSRKDAIRFENVTLHPIPPDEFAVECYLRKD